VENVKLCDFTESQGWARQRKISTMNAPLDIKSYTLEVGRRQAVRVTGSWRVTFHLCRKGPKLRGLRGLSLKGSHAHA